jgi:hypothetical protein
MRDWKTAGAKRLRHWIVFGGLVVMLAIAAVFAKSGCGQGEPIFARGDAWATYLGSLFFVLLGWGSLGSRALGHFFLRLGWEPDFRPVPMTTEAGDVELSRGAKRWVAYPLMAIIGGVGFWIWFKVNGCDVIVLPMRGIAA